MRSRSSVINRKEKRKRKLTAVIFIVLAVAAVITLINAGYGDVYRNEAGFKKFVDDHFASSELYDVAEIETTDYHYADDFSFAVEYSVCSDPVIKAFRDDKIEIIKGAFGEQYKDIDEDGEEDNIKKALLLKTNIYEASNGAINLVIFRTDVVQKGKQLDIVFENVYTYQFSKKTKDALVPQQVFLEDYRYYCEDYFKEYFSHNYSEDELIDGWEEKLLPTEDNYNKYIVTDSGVTFFFEEGAIVADTLGFTCAGIASLQAEPILRDVILERYIDPNRPMVALTYDDGPGGRAEDRILDCLQQNNVVATFFYQGVFIEGREEKIDRARKMGCEIGHHTWSHPVLTSLDKKGLKKQFDKTNKAIYDACGAYPTVFRPSYGETDSTVNKMSKLPVIMWSLDTVDWESRNGKKVFELVKKSGNLDGDIILLHSIHDSTADATEMLIPWLKKKGYQLVTVSELIKYKTGTDPAPGKVYRIIK